MKTEMTAPILHGQFHFSGRQLSELIASGEVDSALQPEKCTPFERVTLFDQTYSVVEGYLVPYYPREVEGEVLLSNAEEFTTDRVKRFFYTAQPELDVRWTREQVQAERAAYEACIDPDLKASKARFLVGAMINRIDRLARVYFHADYHAVNKLDLTPEQVAGLEEASRPLADLRALRRLMREHPGTNVAEREKKALQAINVALKPVQREFGEYFSFMVLSHPEILNEVNLRDGSPDRDGILPHLVREMAKEWGYENENQQALATQNVVTHIGQTMAAIDETRTAMRTLLKQKNVLQSLNRALRAYKETLPPENVALHAILDKGAANLIEEFAALSRARAGIKSDDPSGAFSAVRERSDLMKKVNYEVLKGLRNIGRDDQEVATSEVRDLLSDGFSLMETMGQLRIPRNRHAPAFFDKKIGADKTVDNPDDQSSVRRFERKVEAWTHKHTVRAR